MTSKFYIPTSNPQDWKSLLAEPDKQWKTGYSAKALAYCWQEAKDFPECVRNAFKSSKIELFQDIKILVAFPEYQVPLPGGPRPSQNDIFVLAKSGNQLVSIMVEGKVSEPFGPTVEEWKKNYGKGKEERLRFLLNELQLSDIQMDAIRYQLLHRTASALIEAKRFNVKNALMLVHSFSQTNEGFDDYCRFFALLGLKGKKDSLAFAKSINGIDLYFGWVKGEEKYLCK
jgi:hypothetical protein